MPVVFFFERKKKEEKERKKEKVSFFFSKKKKKKKLDLDRKESKTPARSTTSYERELRHGQISVPNGADKVQERRRDLRLRIARVDLCPVGRRRIEGGAGEVGGGRRGLGVEARLERRDELEPVLDRAARAVDERLRLVLDEGGL